jgi:tRNA nucleotidyltransferase (CCA-adding enzyme)
MRIGFINMDAIVTHSGGDFDCLASLIIAKKIYPDSVALLPPALEKQVREFLSLYQDVFDLKEEKHFDFSKVRRLIIVDTRIKDRIGQAKKLLDKERVKVHIYDHHPKTAYDIKADKEVSRKTGATATILLDEIKRRRIGITALEATVMCLGIYEDTGSLTFRSTTKEDVDAVSFLLSQGADLNIVSSYLNRQLTEEELSILIKLIENTETQVINGIAVAISSLMHDEYIPDLAVLTHRLIDIENFNVIFVLVKVDSKIQMIARSSLPGVDVNQIAGFFGGGGHPSAASCVIRNMSLKEVKEKLISLLRDHLKPEVLAKDIMNTDFKTITESAIITEVKRNMIKYNVGEMPVLKNKKIVGLVTRSDLDKAIYLGFGHSKVKGYMSREVICVNEDTPASKIKKLFYEHDIGRVPVLKENKVIGIITRIDFLGTKHKKLAQQAQEAHSKKHQDAVLSGIFKDLTPKMKKILPPEVFKLLKKIGKIADDHGFKIYAVGGMIRDLILGCRNIDVDLVVEGQAIEFAGILSKEFGAKLIVYKRFGTAILIMPDKFKIDLASARYEYYEYPAALPTVELSLIRNDLARRDFTINAMAIGLNRNNFGQLIDFFGGLEDIKNKKIRTLHNLSFVEDPTRIFRAVRFEQRYDFKIDSQSEHLIKTAVDTNMFARVAGERMRDEIVPILNEADPIKGVKRMFELHELRFIHQNLKLTKTTIKYFKSIKRTAKWVEEIIDQEYSLWLVYFFALCHNLSLVQLKKVLGRFVFSKKDTEKLISLKKNNKKVLNELSRTKKLKASKVFKLLRPYSIEFMLMILSKTSSYSAKRRIKTFLKQDRNVSLQISGEDLKKLGLKPSYKFKMILDKVLQAKLDLALKSKREELEYLKTLLGK